jgi:hypothetical protein
MECGKHKFVDQKLRECIMFMKTQIKDDESTEEIMIYCFMMNLRLTIILIDNKGMDTLINELNKYKVITPEFLILKAKTFAIRNEWKSFRTVMNKLRGESKKDGNYLKGNEKEFEEIIVIEKDYDNFQEDKKREKLIGQYGKIYCGFLDDMEKIKKCIDSHNFNEAIDLGSKLWFKLIILDDPIDKSTKIIVLQIMVESKL